MEFKLEPEKKRLILEALRSGKYEQIEGYLHYNDCFCAEGVLCDVFAQQTKTSWISQYEGGPLELLSAIYCAPYEVYEWLSSNWKHTDAKCTPTLRYNGRHMTLYGLNDEDHLTFAQIANLVEAQW